MKSQKGFTMIELVMVIVILGILAAVAIPRFVDLKNNAQQAAVDGMAGSLSAASSVNHAACAALNHEAAENKCVKVEKCSDVAPLVKPALTLGAAGEAIADTYNLAADTAVSANDAEATCTLQYKKLDKDYTATYSVMGAGQ